MLIVKVINKYNITSKFYYHVVDNALNNNNATTNALAKMLNIKLSLKHYIYYLRHM